MTSPVVPPLTCSKEGCETKVLAKGLCSRHYQASRYKFAPPKIRNCKRCGKPIPLDSRNNRKYCDDECRFPGRPARTTDKHCAEEGCERYPNSARGYCRTCYARRKAAGDFGGQMCSHEGCARLARAKGMCNVHHFEAKKAGLIPAAACSVEGCKNIARARDLCSTHYYHQRTTGSPGPAKGKNRASGTGSIDPNGYIVLQVNKRRVLEHRFVMEHQLGRLLWPDESVHHKNGQRADNRPENLELWSKAQPAGQRVEDKVAFAIEMLRRYRPELLTTTE